ncbi:hypothetical protein LIER_39355 [Lithospermum erythrorhizon]|uniref:C2H2-type domain-containing protein n=1 Tax=Lithospermum erythrorhizon TaxID=34254 RepID=A0AAV3QIZ9_LITER
MDQQLVLKHYCKVCNRGFGCAGALGGHMRSHSIADNNVDNIIKYPDGANNNNTKHQYFLRNNSNKFTIWDQDSSPNHENGLRHQFASSEEEDLANCLVMLSNKKYVLSSDEKDKDMEKDGGINGFQCKACKKVFSSHQALGGHRASHKKVKGCYAAKFIDDDYESNATHHDLNQDDDEYHFSPSHSSPDEAVAYDSRRKTSKVHECSICHRVFSSGQALGGHKRCHWLTTSNLSDNTFIPYLQDFQYYDPEYQHIFKKPMLNKQDGETKFDLNFPPSLINFNSTFQNDNMKCNLNNNNGDGELQGKTTTKMSRLNELKDLHFDEGPSRWLQMGIPSNNTNTS